MDYIQSINEINQIVSESMAKCKRPNNGDIRVYTENDNIIVEGPIYDEKNMLTLESLRHPMWDKIPKGTNILFKNFAINIGNEISSACATYMLRHFCYKTIADCVLVKQITYTKKGQDGIFNGYN